MPIKKNNPGCPCCECLIYQTAFASAAVLADDWTTSGTVSIVSGELQITTAGATAILDTVHPQYPYPPRLSVQVKGGSSAELRLFLSYSAGGTDGIVIELRPAADGCGELDIYQISSSSETLLSGTHGVPGLVNNEWHHVAACYDPRDGAISVVVHTADDRYTTITATISGHTYGEYAGLGTGATHSGTGYFDSFLFERLWYYGDAEQDDWGVYGAGYYYDQTIIECSPCNAWGTCEWISADFSHADNICEWSGATSDWTITSNWITADGTGTGISLILHKTAYPWDDRTTALSGNYLGIIDETQNAYTFEMDHYHRIAVTITFIATAGSVLYGVICAVDRDNYIAAKVIVGDAASDYCGTIQLISVASGVSTDISDVHVVRGLVSGTTWVLQLSYYDGLVAAQIGDHGYGSRLGIQLQAEATYGPYVGLGADDYTVYVTEFDAGCRQLIETCQLDSGDFDWDATTWQTCVWDLLSGSWPTRDASDQLVVDADTAMQFQNPVPIPYRDAHKVQLTAAIKTSAQDDTAVGIIFGSDLGGDNYYLAEVNYAAAGSTLTIYQVNSGSRTQLTTSSSGLPYPFTMTACAAGGRLYAAVTSGAILEADGDSYGGYTGFTGSVPAGASSGDLVVTQFTTHRIGAGLNAWSTHWVYLCTGCRGTTLAACLYCADTTISDQYQLTASGFEGGQCSNDTGEWCDIDRTVIADAYQACAAAHTYEPDPQPTCTVSVSGFSFSRSLTSITYTVYFTAAGGGQVRIHGLVTLSASPYSIVQYQFAKDVDAPLDCQALSAVELDLVGMNIYNTDSPLPCWPGYDEYLDLLYGTSNGRDTSGVKMYVTSL